MHKIAIKYYLVIIIITFFAAIGYGQEKTAMSADQTLRSNARVNPSTLGMELSIPLAAYPGRGLNASVSLSYSSKLWRMEQVGRVPYINTNQCYGLSMPRFAELSAAGWTSDLAVPYIEYTGLDNPYDELGKPINSAQSWCPTDTEPQGINHVRRITVHLPGGGTHELRASTDLIVSQPASTYNANNVSWNAFYYSVDGSNLIYHEDSANSIYRLYLTDGSRIDFGGTVEHQAMHQTERTIRKATNRRDRNGNKMTYHAADANHPNGYITDTMGRVIDVPIGLSAPTAPTAEQSPQQYTVPGLTGTQGLTYGLHWRRLEDVRTNTNAELCYTAHGFPYPNFPQPPTAACKLFSGAGDAAISDHPANGVFNPIVLARIDLPNGSSYKFSYDIYGRIDRIEYPTGGIETFDYSQIPVMTPMITMGVPDTNDLANFGVTHREVSESAGATPIEWDYLAEKLNSPLSYKVTTDAPDSTKSESYLKIELGGGIYGFESPLNGMPYDEQSFDSANNLRAKKLTTYATFGTNERTHPRATRVENIIYEPATSQALSASVVMSYQTINSITDPLLSTSVAEYAFTTNPGNLGSLERISETDYLNDSNYAAQNLRSLPTETRVKDASGNIKAKSQIFYDETGNYPLIDYGSTTSWENPNTSYRANPTTTRSWYDITNNYYVESHAQYDNFGNQRKIWDGRGNMTETEYSATYLFAYPTKVKSPIPDTLGTNGANTQLISETTFDFNTGLPLTSKDANNQTTTLEYNDALLRPTKAIAPNGHQTITEYGAGTSEATRWIKSKTQIDETNWKEGYSWFDGLGRTIKSQSVDSNGDVFALTCYDQYGRVEKVSNPFRNVPNANCQSSLEWTANTYDTVGRVWKITTPDGAFVETNYGLATSGASIGTTVTATDQAGKLRRSVTNGLGQLSRVDEPNDSNQLGTISSPNQPTLYGYDTLNNLITVNQGVQTRSFAYDSLSRLKTATNPESGAISYIYDNNGNLTSKTDARSITTSYVYDAINRVKTRTYSDSTNPVNYYYDNLTNAKGKLIKVVTGTISNPFSVTEYQAFDTMGKVTQSRQTTDGTAYNPMTYVYNLSGALLEETYPSGRVVKNTLNADGELSQVQSKKANDTFKNYANSFNYTAAGAVSSMKLGNGRWENTSFNARLQPTQIGLGTSATNQSLLKLNYDYGTTDNNGNVKSQTITVERSNQSPLVFNQTYTYDSLNRLKQAVEMTGTTQNWKQTYIFDRYGNRQFDVSNGNTTTLPQNFNPNIYNPTIDTANNRFTTGQGYTYDLAGNLLTDAEGRSFTYDGENKQKDAKNASNQIIGQYFYDGNGKRVKKKGIINGQAEETIFVYDALGKLVAEYSTVVSNTPKIQYQTSDNLGTPRINTDEKGAIVSRSDYLPYGEEIVGLGNRTSADKYFSDDVRQGFTGYEKDEETDLDFAQARMYANKLGRFTTTDPIYIELGRLFDPQSINLYAYVRNSPLIFIDPTGLSVEVKDKTSDKKGKNQFRDDFNSRKKAAFQVDYRDNKLVVVNKQGKEIKGDALKTLGESITDGKEKELFTAINDSDNKAVIEVFRKSDQVDFGAKMGEGRNAVDLEDLDILNKANDTDVNSKTVIGHEMLEAYGSAKGEKDPHSYANGFFPGLGEQLSEELLPDKNQLIGGVVLRLPVHNSTKIFSVIKLLTKPSPYKTTEDGNNIPTGDVKTGHIGAVIIR